MLLLTIVSDTRYLVEPRFATVVQLRPLLEEAKQFPRMFNSLGAATVSLLLPFAGGYESCCHIEVRL